ncbi:LacI family DNA-binding transcriptional regulator [Kitasatospora sp. NPDC051914]|uniref:LacI family DNA-binding transcriptional regulator n=1 Tax=Kitasatospora sp. NPDC051914 TaxID=3154945 RepID=UPI0034459428
MADGGPVRRRGKPTAGDVAAAAGVSRTAVSFAFNSPDQLSRATRARILAVAEELGYRPSPLARRLAGVADGLAEAGLTLADVELAEVPISRADGHRTARDWMARAVRPTAILALSDILAFGALEGLRDLGVDVPGEVSVVGFDDLPEAARTRPGLTTVRQDMETKGRTAAEALLAAVHGEAQPQRRTLPTGLVVRGSTAAPPATRGRP